MRLFNFFRVLFFLLFLAFTFNATAQQTALSQTQLTLLREALRTALSTEKNLPDYQDLKNKKEIILHNELVNQGDVTAKTIFITEDMLPKLNDEKIRLMTREEIRKKAEKEDLLFVRLGLMPDPEEEYGPVNIYSQWELSNKSRKKGLVYRQSYGRTLLFKKTDGAWQFEKAINTFNNYLDLKH